ncbi:hypothetical protein BJF93_15695 [Xaviernesmea oryzae]|uniref:Uncharacterized protein n=2 Tax=Xaviernesmea oryzae TaxID=464029 RepID=A0A1Q9AY91_9HYPH|nr:hypothetical protein BJF93_15695 [Xaviernesmea oryzae]
MHGAPVTLLSTEGFKKLRSPRLILLRPAAGQEFECGKVEAKVLAKANRYLIEQVFSKLRRIFDF